MSLNMWRTKIVRVTRAPFNSTGGGVLKACDTTTGRRVGAVVVDVGPDQDKAIQRAERKAHTYGKALVGLASLLCLSVCGNIASSALCILALKQELPISGVIRQRSVVLPEPKAAAPVVTGLTSYGGSGLTPAYNTAILTSYGAEVPTHNDDTFPLGVSSASMPGAKKCAIAARDSLTLTYASPFYP